MLDIDWIRWDSSEYTLRMDEVDEVASLLGALSLGLRQGILMLGPSYASEAGRLRHVDWMPSDDEPIDATGAPAFAEGSVLKKAWEHSKRVTLKRLLIFHYDSVRRHWLLFSANLSTEEIICYEPLANHGEGVDVEDIILLMKFFKPQRQAQMPSISPAEGYTLNILDVQHDSSACGFWMITLAFLIICEVSMTTQSIGTLRVLGPENLKRHWKYLLTSWRIEERGLAFQPVNDFLGYWNCGYEQKKKNQILAPRPEWIPRFDPQQILDLLREADKLSGDSEQHEPAPGLVPKHTLVPDHEQVEDPTPHQMPSDEQLQVALRQLEWAIQGYESQQKTLSFWRESLAAEDLRRFIDFDSGKANDEIINMFVAIFSWTSGSDTLSLHYGDIFGLPPPSRDFKIMTTFFYLKLKDLLAAQDPETGDPEKAKEIHEKLVRWFKKDDMKQLKRIFIPVNEPAQIHWFLVVLSFDSKSIFIYDSLAPAKNSAIRTHYAAPAQLVLLALQVIATASDGLPFISTGWSLQVERAHIPVQNNAIDCGFYMLMAMIHLLYMRKVHQRACPPNLRFGPETMKKTRTILATSLFEWIKRYGEANEAVHGLKVDSPVPSSVDGEEDIRNLNRNADSPVPSSVEGEDDELIGLSQKTTPADDPVLSTTEIVVETDIIEEVVEADAQETDSVWGSPLTTLPSSFDWSLSSEQLRRGPPRTARPKGYQV
ncbi:hypothetical protein C8R43DRAFT_1053345 [Mycena crocata]|nr:hypothetical protein C8R43DRAFT_1053345 [Mycena crocata]